MKTVYPPQNTILKIPYFPRFSNFRDHFTDFLDLEEKPNFTTFTLTSAHPETIENLVPGQGCGNTMPDLSDLVPFHSGQVENIYLLVLGEVQMYV